MVEKLFDEFPDPAFSMRIINPSDFIMVSNGSTFIKAYSRRGRKRRY